MAERCTFTRNVGASMLYAINVMVQLRDCVFDSNNAATDQATVLAGRTATIERTLFINNNVGPAIRAVHDLTLRSVVFVRNGLAMWVDTGTVVAANVVWIGTNFGLQTLINQLGGSLSFLNNTFMQNTSAISFSGGTRTVTNSVFFQTSNPFNLSATANSEGNIDLPNGSLSPFLRTFSSFDIATLWGPDAISFTRDDAYVLVPSNANELIDKGVSTGAQTDIHGTSRPFDHPGVTSGPNGTTFDIGASEAL